MNKVRPLNAISVIPILTRLVMTRSGSLWMNPTQSLTVQRLVSKIKWTTHFVEKLFKWVRSTVINKISLNCNVPLQVEIWLYEATLNPDKSTVRVIRDCGFLDEPKLALSEVTNKLRSNKVDLCIILKIAKFLNRVMIQTSLNAIVGWEHMQLNFFTALVMRMDVMLPMQMLLEWEWFYFYSLHLLFPTIFNVTF